MTSFFYKKDFAEKKKKTVKKIWTRLKRRITLPKKKTHHDDGPLDKMKELNKFKSNKTKYL